MANNRIIFRCRACGDELTFFKFYPETGWYRSNVVPDIEALETWFDDHYHAWEQDHSPLGGFHFDFGYENDGDQLTLQPKPATEETT